MTTMKRCCKCRKDLTNEVVCRNCGHAACTCPKCRECSHSGCASVVCVKKGGKR